MKQHEILLFFLGALALCGYGLYVGMTGNDAWPSHDSGCSQQPPPNKD